MTSPEPTLRPLAVCIDDLALHEGVNRSAIALWMQGRVSSWSVLVDGPALAGLASWCRAQAHDTPEIGLHLNLTEPLPGAGDVRPLGDLVRAAWLRRLAAADLRRELLRQWDRFVDAFGRPPDFVDGHQHVHQFPGVREALLAMIAERCHGTAPRPWLRCCRPPPLPWGERGKALVIGALGARALARAAAAAGLSQNRRLLGVRRFEADEAGYGRQLAAWLDRVGDGDLLMVHPALGDGGQADPLRAARAAEHAVLAGEGFGAALRARGLRVARLRPRL